MKQIILDNDLYGGDYCEAYAGGAGIAWKLLQDGFVTKVHLNDLNQAVYSFWHSVINETDALCQLIQDTPVTMDTWYQQKKIQNSADSVSILDLGFSTFFLNRTNRSGIIWAGVIGGKKQDGNYKLDARYNKKKLINRIEKIAFHKNKIEIYNQDALKFINTVVPTMNSKTLIYLDPPYYHKGAGLYTHHYNHNDHVYIAEAIANINLKWLVSYDNTHQIREIYKNYKSVIYSLSYSTQDRYSGSEIVFFSPKLVVSSTQSPLNYKNPKTLNTPFIQMGI